MSQIADQVHRENAKGKAPSPFGPARQTKSRQTEGGAYRCHKRNRPIADVVEVSARIGAQTPDRIQETPGKSERQHDHDANHCAGREENDEKKDWDRTPAALSHA